MSLTTTRLLAPENPRHQRLVAVARAGAFGLKAWYYTHRYPGLTLGRGVQIRGRVRLRLGVLVTIDDGCRLNRFVRFTGTGTPLITMGEREVPASLRPAEILTALALHPDGLTGEQLTLMLYGDDGNPTTLRGEIHRLRALLGNDLLLTRPYRLAAVPDADFLRVRAALRAGRVGEALDACHGPLLPRSDAPAVRDLRDELTAGLRHAVLASDDVELTHRFAEHPLAEEDLEAHERLLELLGSDDPRRAAVAARAQRLLD